MVSPPPAVLSDRGFSRANACILAYNPWCRNQSGVVLFCHFVLLPSSAPWRQSHRRWQGPGGPGLPFLLPAPRLGSWRALKAFWHLPLGKPHAARGAGERRPPRVPAALPAALLESGSSGRLPGLGGWRSPSPAPHSKPTGTTLTLFFSLLPRYYEIKKQP